MKRLGLAALLAMSLVGLACTLSFDLGQPDNFQRVSVEAEAGWTATGIIVGAGDLLSIQYISGTWSPWPGGAYDAIGSGGDPRCRCNVMDAVSHAALIGRIEGNPPFLVGEHYRHRVGETGQLYLGINDVDLFDNSGSLEVEVTVLRR